MTVAGIPKAVNREEIHRLLDDWDPIGVAGIPEAQDEYAAYEGEVCEMIRHGATVKPIFKFLREAEVKHMGLGLFGTGRRRTMAVAKKLAQL